MNIYVYNKIVVKPGKNLKLAVWLEPAELWALRTLLANVLCQRVLHAHMPSCQHALRAHVPTVFRTYVLTCQRVLLAHVL